MYSMVLMMALTTGGEAPAFGHGCCGGYTSCCGGTTVVYSCCGGHSCCGGGHKLFGGLFAGHKHGCCGGYSCCGGSGCCGGTVIYSGCCGGTPAPATPPPAMIPEKPKEVKPMGEEMKPEPKPEPKPEEKKPEAKPEPKEGAFVPAPATILVSLPADAKLTIDDNATVSTSANRRFVTPTLQSGRDFTYTLKAEVVRDGKPLATTKVITVRAGETTQVEIEVPTAVAAK
jgi:uncharacterized protein (TIGR03000 family)